MLTHTPQVDGKQKVMFALTQIKGVGRRYSNLVCKKADVDLNKRYGTLENTTRHRTNTNVHLQRRRAYLRRA